MEKQELAKLKVLWWANADWCGCFDVETEVLTEDGFKFFKDLLIADKVATLNPLTHVLEYHHPEAVINQPYTGLMYRHISNHIDLMCTPDHKLFVRKKGGEFQLTEAKEIFGDDGTEHYCGGATWIGKDEETISIPHMTSKNGLVKEIGKVDTSNFVKWLGWYLCEGSYTIGSKREYIVGLALNHEEADEVYELSKATFPTLTWFKTPEKLKVNIRTYSKDLYHYVEPLGRSHDKHVPKNIKNLTPKYLEPLLNSLLAGDGRIDGSKYSFCTCSPQLRDDVIEIALKLGEAASCVLHHPSGSIHKMRIEDREITSNYNSWHVSIIRKRKTPGPIKGKFIEKYIPNTDGRVYCAIVPPNHIMVVRRNGKIYFSGNTGYGVGTRGVLNRIKDRFDTRLLCFYGLEGKAFYVNDYLRYPKLFSPMGDDAADLIVKNWNPDCMITFFDIWIAEMPDFQNRDFFLDIHQKWIPWIPVDHDPSPVGITNQARKAYHPVAMSRFGQRMLKNEDIESTLIPLGADTSVFRPVKDIEEKRENREYMTPHSIPMTPGNSAEWNPDDFIIGVNAAPKDPVRKNFVGMFDAFKIFLEQNPDARKDARMHLHTWKNFPGGWPLGFLAKERGIDSLCRVTHPYAMYCGLNEDAMGKMTRSWDVLFNLATREGFGIGIAEANASGVPPIVTNFTSMPELVEGHGWVIDYTKLELTNLLSYGAEADVFDAADALEDAYNHPDKVKALGEKARTFSLDYDWEVIAQLWVHLLEELSPDLIWTPRDRRKIV